VDTTESARAADVVILAGDIDSHTNGLEWAARSFMQQPIIYIAGNHEYYGSNLGLLDEMRKKADALQIHFLERNAVEIDGGSFSWLLPLVELHAVMGRAPASAG